MWSAYRSAARWHIEASMGMMCVTVTMLGSISVHKPIEVEGYLLPCHYFYHHPLFYYLFPIYI